ncbi:thiol-disulfide oxidoreductase DCC family protein [Microbulbifer halophilus]|uniref:Thiol-disulfide oxidoreductase DCC family protein n=1 Tax=Microbulbifer halophilus TaxID=453963 RepID=A0ABW5EG78_9GAMM|nr:thiol-disulfide oxidoreductase DCC family protein [Microbulbifer halophilus]MCW8128385.1 thiol-disulfide oxidoreductase DCC family protein [Microbulbifer halophilus]
MNQQSQIAPGVAVGDRVVLFDGVCRLCSVWARFLIKFDRKRQFKLATVQSPEGKAILQWHSFPTDHYETMLLVEGVNIYTKSSAFFRVMQRLPWPWPIMCIGWAVPSIIRDWLYDRVALNRYRLFGRYEACVIPNKDHNSRFLGE